MNDRDIYISVIIPAYNEERRIEKTLYEIAEFFSKKPYGWEVLVVSDGSTDKTVRAVERIAKEISQLKIIDRKVNMGKGYTVREGMLAAMGKIRLFMDADNSTNIEHFERMRPLFDNGADVVIASRDAKDAPGASQDVKQAAWKRMLGNLGNLYIQLVAVPGIWDTQCGFKAFRREAAEKIFQASRIRRWGFDIETLALARKFRFRVEKIPAHWINDVSSHVRATAYLQVLWETTKIAWWLRRGYEGESRIHI